MMRKVGSINGVWEFLGVFEKTPKGARMVRSRQRQFLFRRPVPGVQSTTADDAKAGDGSLSVTEAARIAGVPKGTMSRWRKLYGLAASNGTRIDRERLAKLLETRQACRNPGGGHSQGSRPSGSDGTVTGRKQPPSVRRVVWRMLRQVTRATYEEIVAEVRRLLPDTSTAAIRSVLGDWHQFRFHPGSGLEPSYYTLFDE